MYGPPTTVDRGEVDRRSVMQLQQAGDGRTRGRMKEGKNSLVFGRANSRCLNQRLLSLCLKSATSYEREEEKGALTNDVSTQGGEGVSQFLTKGRKIAWTRGGSKNSNILADVICKWSQGG